MRCDSCFDTKQDIKDLVEVKEGTKIIRLCLSCYMQYKGFKQVEEVNN